MKAVISTTWDNNYLFFLPITTWAWNQLGIDVICFIPDPSNNPKPPTWPLIFDLQRDYPFLSLELHRFNAPSHKLATYAQCSRLYAAALPLDENEVLITGDVDMAVFNIDFFQGLNNSNINIVGADLVPNGQFPICYVSMPVYKWRNALWMNQNQTPQEKLDYLLAHLDCDHFRGNYWAKDQETVYNHIIASEYPIVKHFRAKPGTQFATRRADRDGWPEIIIPDIIDAHLPRPGYTIENFGKILNLFQTMYPTQDFNWMTQYFHNFHKALNY